VTFGQKAGLSDPLTCTQAVPEGTCCSRSRPPNVTLRSLQRRQVDRRWAGDGAEARGMDALIDAILEQGELTAVRGR
jgi:hypothetical protein